MATDIQMLLLEELQARRRGGIRRSTATGTTTGRSTAGPDPRVIAEYVRKIKGGPGYKVSVVPARGTSVSALSKARHGYRYVDKHTGGGEAALQVIEEEARRWVRQILFHLGGPRWLVFAARSRHDCSSRVCRRDRSPTAGTPGRSAPMVLSPTKGMRFLAKDGPAPRDRASTSPPGAGAGSRLLALTSNPASEHIGI